MREALIWLRKGGVFSELADSELERLASASEVRHLEPGETLLRAGNPQRWVVHLVEGKMAIYRTNKARSVTLLLGVLVAPAVFGDAECAAGAPWMCSARAEENMVVVLMENAAFLSAVQRSPTLSYRMYLDASVRHLLANHTAQTTALYDVETRLLRILLDYAGRYGRREGDDVHVGRKISQVELAAALGVTRKTITRTVSPLEKDGTLTRDEDGAFVIHGLEAIRARLPENVFGVSTKLGEPTPPVISRWQSDLEHSE